MLTDMFLLCLVTTRFTSYAEMNRWEINNLFSDTAKNINGKLYIIGDFNVGPAIPAKNVVGDNPANYALVNDLGKKVSYLFYVF